MLFANDQFAFTGTIVKINAVFCDYHLWYHLRHEFNSHLQHQLATPHIEYHFGLDLPAHQTIQSIALN